jgi:hypothetical protein
LARRPEQRCLGESLELVGRHRDGSKFPFEIGLNPIRAHEDLPVLRELPDEFSSAELSDAR